MAVEAVVPSVPRNGSYLAVYALTDIDAGSGGDVRVEVDECGTCYALVETSRMDGHVSALHVGDAEPKSR
jgi:hypothetical protein